MEVFWESYWTSRGKVSFVAYSNELLKLHLMQEWRFEFGIKNVEILIYKVDYLHGSLELQGT